MADVECFLDGLAGLAEPVMVHFLPIVCADPCDCVDRCTVPM
jgi:hypothetical protein